MDINHEINKALAPLGVPFYSMLANFDDYNIPEAYIVFAKIYGDERGFSDNEARSEYFLYRINVFAQSEERTFELMAAVVEAMKSCGWYLQEKNIPISREKQAEYHGAFSEFVKEVFREDG